jgi:CRISPR-associated exonuclease Cas4
VDEDDYLLLSGIQHFAFCQRQWALIHIEGLWEENILTIGGRHLHRRVDKPWEMEKRGNLIVARSVPIVSTTLGLTGKADLVEFHLLDADEEKGGVMLPGRAGHWKVCPVEYKRGRPKKDDRDAVQIGAQAICLEEMLGATIAEAALFYGEIRRRERVSIDEGLRWRVRCLAEEMHELYAKGRTPPAVRRPHCRMCSLVNLCLPRVSGKSMSASAYLQKWASN